MRISDFAARAGLTPRQVRHYTDVGLLSATRLGNGYRDYDPAHVEQARRVHALIAVGLSCEQVLPLIGCLGSEETAACPAASSALAAQLASIEERIEQLEDTRRLLRDRLAVSSPASGPGARRGAGGTGNLPANERPGSGSDRP